MVPNSGKKSPSVPVRMSERSIYDRMKMKKERVARAVENIKYRPSEDDPNQIVDEYFENQLVEQQIEGQEFHLSFHIVEEEEDFEPMIEVFETPSNMQGKMIKSEISFQL